MALSPVDDPRVLVTAGPCRTHSGPPGRASRAV